MNKCNQCKYLCYPEYESSYSECQIFGEEPPEEYWEEDGCSYSEELLEQLLEKKERALEKEHEAYVKWFLEQEQEKDGKIRGEKE